MDCFAFRKSGRTLLLSAVIVAMLVGTVSAQKGTFTDSRDGQKYKTVKIGDRTWTAENLNYQAGDSWCYGNDDSKCKQYGRLYDWNTAKAACPAGWHLPTREEWDGLVAAAGGDTAGRALKSAAGGWKDGGGGTDAFGFSALPGGYRFTDGSFDIAGRNGLWWSATEDGIGGAYYRFMDYGYDKVYETGNYKGNGFSVRCVKED